MNQFTDVQRPITFWFYELGRLDHVPNSFPITAPNVYTAQVFYDALIAAGLVPASARP